MRSTNRRRATNPGLRRHVARAAGGLARAPRVPRARGPDNLSGRFQPPRGQESPCPTSRRKFACDRSTSSTSEASSGSTSGSRGTYRPDFWEQRVMYYLRRDPESSQVAEMDGKVVGLHAGRRPRAGEFGLEEPSGWIERFGIDPDHRGRDLGRQMFDAIVAHFRERGRHHGAHAGGRKDAGGRGLPEGARVRALAAPGARDAAYGRDGAALMKVETRSPSRRSTTTRSSTGARHWTAGLRLAARATGTSTSPRTSRSACAPRWSSARSDVVQIGEHKGEKKRLRARRADRGGGASTCSRSSARRPRPSSARSSSTPARSTARPDDEDRFWVLRVMAEELRHGYQMFHLLLSQDWSHVSGGVKGEDMVEEILSMQTGIARARRVQPRVRLVRRQHRASPRSSTASASTSSRCRRCAPTSRWPTRCRRCCARRRSTSRPA